MTKPSFLSRLTSPQSVPALSVEELANRRSAAEAALREAEALHRAAALDAENGIPGAIQRKVESVEALRLAQERLRDIMGAQIEAHAAENERARIAKLEAEAAQDDAVRSAAAAWLESVEESQSCIAKYVPGYEGLVARSETLRE
jgi:hypothetical protein